MRMKMSINEFKQSKLMTIIEQVANVGSGMLIAFTISQLAVIFEGSIQYYIWSGFHWSVSASSNALMTVVLTIVSVMRGYCWRRLFNHHHAKKLHNRLKEKHNGKKSK